MRYPPAAAVITPQHTCPEESALRIGAICDDGSIGASDIFILIVIVVVLAAIGIIVYNVTKRRFEDD